MFYILMYLGAIVLANVLTAMFGAGMSVINAFLFIGLDLTARDKLHDAWHGNGLVWKMGLLILAGSVLSWAVNHNAGSIALASFISFACAAMIDTVVYHVLRKKSFVIKANGSNVFSALTDSIIFPTIAFGGFLPLITLGQFIVKVLGGALWAHILSRKKVTA